MKTGCINEYGEVQIMGSRALLSATLQGKAGFCRYKTEERMFVFCLQKGTTKLQKHYFISNEV